MEYDLESIRKEGHKYIIPGRKKEWDTFCSKNIDVNGLKLSTLNQIVDIMKALSDSSMSYDSITKLANEKISHSGTSWSWVVKNVAYYHPKGVDYAINGAQIFLEFGVKEKLLKLEEENKKLIHSNKR